MKTISGITNELREKRARRNWQTRCGTFLLGVVAAWYASHPSPLKAEILSDPTAPPVTVVQPYAGNYYSLSDLSSYTSSTGANSFNAGSCTINVTWDNAGALNFVGGNGPVTLSGGDFNNADGATVNILGGAVVNFGSSDTGGEITFHGGEINVRDGGTLRFQCDNDNLWQTDVNIYGSGVVEMGGYTSGGDENIRLYDGGTIRFTSDSVGAVDRLEQIQGTRGTIDTGGFTIELNSGIADGVDITKAGTGTLVLMDNGGSGRKTITAGTVEFATQDNLGSGIVTFNGKGTLHKTVDDTSDTLTNGIIVNGTSSQGTLYVDTATAATDYMGTDASRLTMTGTLTGNGTFIKSGGGTLAFDANTVNTGFTGDFRIDGGTVVVNTVEAIGINNGGQKLIIGNGIYTADYTGTLMRTINLVNDGTINPLSQFYGFGVTAENVLTLNGAISGTGALNKYGTGTLVLANNDNNYSGATVIDDGVLRINSGTNLGKTSELVIGTSLDPSKTPVFRVTESTTVSTKVAFGNTTSTIEIVGAANTTTLTGSLSGNGNLHKTGEGTLFLTGDGSNLLGETFIDRGTLALQSAQNLNTNTIHLGTGFGDATLSVVANSTVDLSNSIVMDQGSIKNILNVADGSVLRLTGTISSTVPSAALTKTGAGTLILATENGNSYTGATNLEGGTIRAGATDVLSNTSTLNMGTQTVFDMREYDQTIKNLTSTVANPTVANAPKVLIGDKTLTFKTTNSLSEFGGYILGEGTVAMDGSPASVQSARFTISEAERFTGKFQIDGGTLRLGSDAYITGLSGKNGAALDVSQYDLTVDISSNQQYDGTIINSLDGGTFIKTGSGVLTTRFMNPDGGQLYDSSVQLVQGGLTIRGDWEMGADSTLTFNIDNLSTSNSFLEINLVGDAANSHGKADFAEGTRLSVKVADSGGWKLESGQHTIGRIYGNSDSVFSSYTPEELATNLGAKDKILTPDEDVNSLFYKVGKRVYTQGNNKTLDVVADVSGFAGLGGNHNQTQVGRNLDGIRTGNAIPAPLAQIIQDLWAYGSTDITEENRAAKQAMIGEVMTELSGDTMANAMFIGLSRPWRSAFDRLSLDAQMVYAPNPQYERYPGPYRGQAVLNMNQVWFTPFTSSMDVNSDGTARAFGISRQGFQMGYDRRIAQNASAGLLFGYSTPYLYQGDDRVHASDLQFGAYAGAMIGYYFELKGFIGYGHQCYESTRVVHLPTSADPYRVATGRFSGDTFAFSLELTRPLFFGFCIARPTLALDSEHVFRGNFNEQGDAALAYKNTDFHRTMGRVGISAETCTFDRFKVHGLLGFGFLLGGDDYAETSGQYIGVAAPTNMDNIRSVAVGSSYFEAGVGGEIYINPMKTFTMFGDYYASSTDNMAVNTVMMGFRYLY